MVPTEFDEEQRRFKELGLGKEDFDNNNQRKKVEEYTEKANGVLGSYGKTIVDTSAYESMQKRDSLFKIFVILFLVAIVAFSYVSVNGYFKDELIIPPCPNVTLSCPSIPACPSCPACQKCPSNNVSLKCGDLSFPKNLNLNMSGS